MQGRSRSSAVAVVSVVVADLVVMMAMASSSPNTIFGTGTDLPSLPALSKFKIGLCQISVTSNKDENLARAVFPPKLQLIRVQNLLYCQWEMWACPYSSDYFADNKEDFTDKDMSPSFLLLSQLAVAHGITIVGGSIPEWSNGLLYNTCCVFGPDGNLRARHRKLHLFDMDIKGEFSFMESEQFTAGEQPTVVDTDVGRIGIGICHDIRFPELAALYREKGAHIICYPGAFNMSTGELLWEIVQRARAVDNQLFVVTCSPSRNSNGSYMIWGHSTVVGPSGEIIATTGHEETVVIAEIDYHKIQLQREYLQLEKQRRRDIYRFMNVQENAPRTKRSF